jgi:fructoselysine-6-P-deglycase FrlB-like protein
MLRAGLGENLRSTITDAERALESELPDIPKRQLVVLATGWAASLAQEATLKCRESAAVWVEANPSGEYRHGPIAVADEETLVWSLTPLNSRQKDVILATGASVEEGHLDPLAELIKAHGDRMPAAIRR